MSSCATEIDFQYAKVQSAPASSCEPRDNKTCSLNIVADIHSMGDIVAIIDQRAVAASLLGGIQSGVGTR